MLEQYQLRADQRKFADFLGLEAVNHVAHGGQRGRALLRDSRGQGRQQQAQRQKQGKATSHGGTSSCQWHSITNI